jgi:hypothetical protein
VTHFKWSDNPEVQAEFEARITARLLEATNSSLPILKYFQFNHLPAHLRAISARFAEMACRIALSTSSDRAEQVVALRKLLEAKDAAVRAGLQ